MAAARKGAQFPIRGPVMIPEENSLRLRQVAEDEDEQAEKHEESSGSCLPLVMDGVPLSAEIDHERKRPYLPSCHIVYEKIKGSIHIAFLSHLCFILASIFYLKLALATLNWYSYTKRHGVPAEVVYEDTSEVWANYTSENGSDDLLDEWEAYSLKYELLYILGALFFVFVGLLDLLRYFDCLNMVLVLAGVAGMLSALSNTYQARTIWDFVSVHMFLIEAINLLLRKHDYQGVVCFRIGEFCFLIGAVLDCVRSYIHIAGHEELWVIQMDVLACSLWLFSALTEITAEIYYLQKRVDNDDIGMVQCY